MNKKNIILNSNEINTLLKNKNLTIKRILDEQPEEGTINGSLDRWARGLSVSCNHFNVTEEEIQTKIEQLRGKIFPLISPKNMEYSTYSKYGNKNNILWVQETWQLINNKIVYKADCNKKIKWKSSSNMTEDYSRISLIIKDITLTKEFITKKEISNNRILSNEKRKTFKEGYYWIWTIETSLRKTPLKQNLYEIN